MGFVIGFSTFLLGCVDYSLLTRDEVTRLSDVIVDRCVSKYVFLWKMACRINFVMQILRLHPVVVLTLHCGLHLANRSICI